MVVKFFMHFALLFIAGCQEQKTVENKIVEMMPVKDDPIELPQITLPDSWSKKLSVNIGKNSSIKDCLSHLAVAASASINMDYIEDKFGVIYVADDIPFFTIVKEICRLVKWRIRVNERGDITILDDNPYFHMHEVAFLVNTGNPISVSSNDSNTSTRRIEPEINLWTELEDNIKFLLLENNVKDTTGKRVKYSINKQSGMLIVYGTQEQHEKIDMFLQDLNMRVASQVLIEMHILSVDLGEEQQNGIDCNILPFFVGDSSQSSMSSKDSSASSPGINNVLAAIHFVKKFGPTTVVHSPKIMTRNNEPASFELCKNVPFYEVKARKNNVGRIALGSGVKGGKNLFLQGNDAHVDHSSEAKFIKSGISVLVRALIIDFAKRIVAIRLWPYLSSINGFVDDPLISIMGGQVKSSCPIVEKQCIETTITLSSGDVAIFGGLMIDEDEAGVLGFSKGRIIAKAPRIRKKQILFVVKPTLILPDNMNDQSLSKYELKSLPDAY